MTPGQRFRAARWGYVAVVLLATLTQLHFSPDLSAAVERLARAFTPSLGWRDAIDGLRNTVLFAGLGAVWVGTSRSGNVRAEIRQATGVGLALRASVGGPLGRLGAAFQAAGPVSFDTLPLVDLLLFAPAGFVCVMLLRERGRDARWVGVAGAGAALALVAELGHGMLGFPVWWGAVLVRAAGVGLGAWTAHRALAALTQLLRGAARARVVVLAYGG